MEEPGVDTENTRKCQSLRDVAASLAYFLRQHGGSGAASPMMAKFLESHPEAKSLMAGKRLKNFCSEHGDLLHFQPDKGCGVIEATAQDRSKSVCTTARPTQPPQSHSSAQVAQALAAFVAGRDGDISASSLEGFYSQNPGMKGLIGDLKAFCNTHSHLLCMTGEGKTAKISAVLHESSSDEGGETKEGSQRAAMLWKAYLDQHPHLLGAAKWVLIDEFEKNRRLHDFPQDLDLCSVMLRLRQLGFKRYGTFLEETASIESPSDPESPAVAHAHAHGSGSGSASGSRSLSMHGHHPRSGCESELEISGRDGIDASSEDSFDAALGTASPLHHEHEHEEELEHERERQCSARGVSTASEVSRGATRKAKISVEEQEEAALLWKAHLDENPQFIGAAKPLMAAEFKKFKALRGLSQRIAFCFTMAKLQQLGFPRHGMWLSEATPLPHPELQPHLQSEPQPQPQLHSQSQPQPQLQHQWDACSSAEPEPDDEDHSETDSPGLSRASPHPQAHDPWLQHDPWQQRWQEHGHGHRQEQGQTEGLEPSNSAQVPFQSNGHEHDVIQGHDPWQERDPWQQRWQAQSQGHSKQGQGPGQAPGHRHGYDQRHSNSAQAFSQGDSRHYDPTQQDDRWQEHDTWEHHWQVRSQGHSRQGQGHSQAHRQRQVDERGHSDSAQASVSWCDGHDHDRTRGPEVAAAAAAAVRVLENFTAETKCGLEDTVHRHCQTMERFACSFHSDLESAAAPLSSPEQVLVLRQGREALRQVQIAAAQFAMETWLEKSRLALRKQLALTLA